MKRRAANQSPFSKNFLDNLTTTEDREEWFDTEKPDFGAVVYSTGAVSFFWMKKTLDGARRVKLGKYPQTALAVARQEAGRMTSEYEEWRTRGYRPDERPKFLQPKGATDSTPVNPDALTVKTAFEKYVSDMLKTKEKNPAESERSRRYLYGVGLEKYGHLALSALTKDHLMEIKTHFATKKYKLGGRVIIGQRPTGNRVRGLLKTILRHAGANDITTTTKKKFFIEHPSTRYILEEEKPAVLEALEKIKGTDTDIHDIIVIALATGARKTNILEMEWGHYHRDSRTWVVHNVKSEDKKKTYTIELPDEAIEVLERRAAAHPHPTYVFPNPRSRFGHVAHVYDQFKEFCKLAKLENFRFHDLRHTFGTWAANADVPILTISKMMGHSSVAITERYAKPAQKKVREGTDKTAAKFFGRPEPAPEPAQAPRPTIVRSKKSA